MRLLCGLQEGNQMDRHSVLVVVTVLAASFLCQAQSQNQTNGMSKDKNVEPEKMPSDLEVRFCGNRTASAFEGQRNCLCARSTCRVCAW
jgi:hypothetical protein